MVATPNLRTPNNVTVAKMATVIVSKEVTRMIGPDGATNLLKIGALLKLILPLYQKYFDAVDTGVIQLEDVKGHFSPAAWTALTNPKRRLLEEAIKKEVEAVKQQIASHMLYLEHNAHQMETLGPDGLAALENIMRELTGEGGEPV
ncbi:hypothetical protein [Hymenobacter sp. YC55]|uniref:hypothetical protein n=1 Tax=Hymenobacter sp. YC55 TaxID=3034019 RepID=UPI0023F66340|nr:hypothetical protein [Hymenobacter sp. YC55]MDF7810482.1 hypothetical protein [Hymenobacter sp. YC55]